MLPTELYGLCSIFDAECSNIVCQLLNLVQKLCRNCVKVLDEYNTSMFIIFLSCLKLCSFLILENLELSMFASVLVSCESSDVFTAEFCIASSLEFDCFIFSLLQLMFGFLLSSFKCDCHLN